MTDYAGFKHGAATYPLATALTNSLLRDSDPAIYFVIDYFAAMIRTHLGPRFAAELTALGLTSIATTGVAMTVPIDPLPVLRAQHIKFPLLAVYRQDEDYSSRTMAFRHTTARLCVEYILPPLDGGQLERLAPILSSVPKVLDNRIQQGWDPTYTPPGGAAGGHVWSSTHAFLEDVRLLSGKYARYEAGGDLFFPGWFGLLEVKERATINPDDFEALDGTDHTEDLVNAGETTITSFVAFDSEIVPPGPATAGDGDD